MEKPERSATSRSVTRMTTASLGCPIVLVIANEHAGGHGRCQGRGYGSPIRWTVGRPTGAAGWTLHSGGSSCATDVFDPPRAGAGALDNRLGDRRSPESR